MKVWKKRIAVLTALIMVLMMLAACGGNSGTTEDTASTVGSQASDSTSASSNDTTKATDIKMPELVNLTYKTYHAPWNGDENFSETPVGKIIKDKLNISLSVISTGSDDQTAQFITDMAAGNLPDIFTIWLNPGEAAKSEALKKAISEDMVADLTQAVKDYAPVLDWAMKPERMPLFSKNFVYDPAFGGKMYTILENYSLTEPWLSGWGFYIRDDISKTLNLQTPVQSLNTTDDLYNLLKSIQKAGAKDINGKPVYPMGMMGSWCMDSIIRPFDFGGSEKIEIKDGKVSGFIESEYAWKQIEFLRKLVAENLIDPESFTQSWDTAVEKAAQGRYATTPIFANYMSAYPPQIGFDTLVKAHPEMKYMPLGNLQTHLGNKTYTMNKGVQGTLVASVKNGSNVEAAVKLINWLNTKEGVATQNLGVEGQQWNFNDNGYAKATDEAYAEAQQDQQAYNKKYGTGLLNLLANAAGKGDHEYSTFGPNVPNGAPFYQNNPKAFDLETEFANAVMPDRQLINKLPPSMLMNTFPGKDKLQPVWNTLTDTLVQCVLVKTDAEAKALLQKYVDTLNSNGYQDFLKYIEQEVQKNPDLYAEYVTAV